jgi:hypothetical protein
LRIEHGVGGVREAPVMRVAVTRVRRGGVGYARAAAWDTDDTGNRVKTEWTIVDDARAGESRQELTITDASGRRQSLTVALVEPPNGGSQPKGEEL